MADQVPQIDSPLTDEQRRAADELRTMRTLPPERRHVIIGERLSQLAAAAARWGFAADTMRAISRAHDDGDNALADLLVCAALYMRARQLAGEALGDDVCNVARQFMGVKWNQQKIGNAWVTDGAEGFWAQFPRGTSAQTVLNVYLSTADYSGATGTFDVTAHINGDVASCRLGPGGALVVAPPLTDEALGDEVVNVARPLQLLRPLPPRPANASTLPPTPEELAVRSKAWQEGYQDGLVWDLENFESWDAVAELESDARAVGWDEATISAEGVATFSARLGLVHGWGRREDDQAWAGACAEYAAGARAGVFSDSFTGTPPEGSRGFATYAAWAVRPRMGL